MDDHERRLYVVNLPLDIADGELRKVFGLYGTITDVYVNRPAAGRKDRSAFIGFEAAEEAAAAMAVLHDMYKFREDLGPVDVRQARPRNADGTRGYAGSYGNTDAHAATSASDAPAVAGSTADTNGKGGSSPYHQGSAPGPSAAQQPPQQQWQQPQQWEHQQQGSSAGGQEQQNSWQQPQHQQHQQPWQQQLPPQQPPRPMPAPAAGATGSNGPPPPRGQGAPGAKLWVGSLPGDVTQDTIEKVFGTYGQVMEVTLMPVKSRSGQACAFVHFATSQQAEVAMAAMKAGYEIRPGEGQITVEFPKDRNKGGYKGGKGDGKGDGGDRGGGYGGGYGGGNSGGGGSWSGGHGGHSSHGAQGGQSNHRYQPY